MHEEATELIRRLCTRIGAMTEDESDRFRWVVQEGIGIGDRLELLEDAGRAISTFAAAAKALMRG